MNGNPYHVLGGSTPPMLGRRQLFDQLVRQLTKASPDHVSVVGPCHYGKSVLLQHLATQFAPGQGEYLTAAYWDLRHNTPDSDASFLSGFATVLKNALTEIENELASYIDLSGNTLRDEVALVLTELANEKKRILIVMDGFDHVLAATGISRNTWDMLRSFAQMTSLRLVTGSRQRLRELCKTEDSATSDFWEVFNPNPLRVGRFEDHDWDDVLQPFQTRGINFDSSAKKEISNWTGGVPVLVVALLQGAYDSTPDGSQLSKTDIDRFAARTAEERRDVIAALWDACPSEIQCEVVDLQTRLELPFSEVNEDRRREMELRGIATPTRNSLKPGSRLVGDYAQQQSSGLESLRRLFGDSERFSKHSRSMIELRLSQVRSVDVDLTNSVTKAIRDLNHPPDCITWARRIANRAFQLIWGKEMPNGEIPLEWMEDLRATDRRIPAGGRACRVLQQATGTDTTPRLTTHISKRTYTLVNFIHSVGDHGQHLSDDDVSWSYAASFCFAAVELCESLATDLNQP